MPAARNIIVYLFILMPGLSTRAQNNKEALKVLAQLDSIRKGNSPARYFAAIYYDVVESAIPWMATRDARQQQLMDRLERRFAEYFFCGVTASVNGGELPSSWHAYYSDASASELRHWLLGINAHINGDIWQAITSEFSPEELRLVKPVYFSYHKQLVRAYERIYEQAWAGEPKIRRLHAFSLGIDRLYGRLLLSRWRKRQVRLAELYFSDRRRFDRQLARVQRKMRRINKLVAKNI